MLVLFDVIKPKRDDFEKDVNEDFLPICFRIFVAHSCVAVKKWFNLSFRTYAL